MIHGPQDHRSSVRQKVIDYPLLLMLCFSSFIHHVEPFQLQHASWLTHVIQTPLQHLWLIMISALHWNCGLQTRHLLTVFVGLSIKNA